MRIVARWVTRDTAGIGAPAVVAETPRIVCENGETDGCRCGTEVYNHRPVMPAPTVSPSGATTFYPAHGLDLCNACDAAPAVTRGGYCQDCDPDGPPPAVKATKRREKPHNEAYYGLPEVVPVPGAETLYAAFLDERGGKVRHGTKAKPAKTGMYPQRGTGYRYSERNNWPVGGIPLPTGPHETDVTWRKAHPDLERWLSHAEIAGWVLRRWAVTPDTQHLELPAVPGEITVGVILELSADEIIGRAGEIVRDRQREEIAA